MPLCIEFGAYSDTYHCILTDIPFLILYKSKESQNYFYRNHWIQRQIGSGMLQKGKEHKTYAVMTCYSKIVIFSNRYVHI